MTVEEIKDKFKQVVTYSQGINNPQVDDLFSQWTENKKFFKKLMHDKLIWESDEEVVFSMNDIQKKEMLTSFIDLLVSNYPESVNGIIDFLKKIKVDDFYNNHLSCRYDFVDESGDFHLSKGMKTLKCFGYFTDDENLIKEIQQQASMIIQKNCICGKLCLSIHPLDYLSVSDNASCWRSCHALDGEHRSGNLQYMVDTSTVVCYLKSKDDCIPTNFPNTVIWNNKKWRCLLFFDQNFEFVMAGRQYPFNAPNALDEVRNIMTKAGFGIWSHWNNSYLTEFGSPKFYIDRGIPIGNSVIPMEKVVMRYDDRLYYNDLLESSVYINPYYSYNITKSNPFKQTGWTQENKTKIKIGKNVKCLSCGEHILRNRESMKCDFCIAEEEDIDIDKMTFICDCCGSRYSKRECNSVYVSRANNAFDVYFVCNNCRRDETNYCAICDTRYYNTDLYYDSVNDMYLCKICKERMENKNGEGCNCESECGEHNQESIW